MIENTVQVTLNVPASFLEDFAQLIHTISFSTNEQKEAEEQPLNKTFLTWQDVAELFSCGTSKALAIMDTVGAVKVGSNKYLSRVALEEYLAEHGEIKARWPKRKRRVKK